MVFPKTCCFLRRAAAVFVFSSLILRTAALAHAQVGTDDLTVSVLQLNPGPFDREFVGRLHGQLSEFASHIRLTAPRGDVQGLRAEVAEGRRLMERRPSSAVAWITLEANNSRELSARLAILLPDQGQGWGERLVIADLSAKSSRSTLLEEAAIVTREMVLAWRRIERVGVPPEEAIELKERSEPEPTVKETEKKPSDVQKKDMGDLEPPEPLPEPQRDPIPLRLGLGWLHQFDGQSNFGNFGPALEVGLGFARLRISLLGRLGLGGAFSDAYSDVAVRAHVGALRAAYSLASTEGLSLEFAIWGGACIDEVQPEARAAELINPMNATLVTVCGGPDLGAQIRFASRWSVLIAVGVSFQAQTLRTHYEASFDAPRHDFSWFRPYALLALGYDVSFL